MIRDTELIVASLFLLVDYRVFSGLPHEDIMKDSSLAKRNC
jgi:hypothetical protein